jgi:predicted DNA-binding transcriptional regulator AlpA
VQPIPETNSDHSLRDRAWAMQLFGYKPTQRSAFWQTIYSRGVPTVRIGPRKIMFNERAVNDWLEQRSTGKTAG